MADADAIALEKLELAVERSRSHLIARVPADTPDEPAITLGLDAEMLEFFDLETGKAIR